METLYYNRTRLVLGLLFLSAGTLGLGYLLLHREMTEHMHGRAIIFSGAFGHFLTLPVAFFFSLFFTYRLAVTAADAKALEATPTHLVRSSTWRRQEIPWDEVGPAEIVMRRVKKTVLHELVIHRLEHGTLAGELRLALDSMALDPSRWDEYARALTATAEAKRARRPMPAVSTGPADVPAPAAPRGFGRKGI